MHQFLLDVALSESIHPDPDQGPARPVSEPVGGAALRQALLGIAARCRPLSSLEEGLDQSTSSLLQREVADTLRRMGLEPVEGYIDPRSGYELDIYLPGYFLPPAHVPAPVPAAGPGPAADSWPGQAAGLAVEVDGPSHFTLCRKQLGSTRLKHRHIRALAYPLVSLPYWLWPPTAPARVALLRRLLPPRRSASANVSTLPMLGHGGPRGSSIRGHSE